MKRSKKIQGDQLPIDELLPEVPAIARLEWVSGYESIESVLMEYLNLEAE